MMAEVSDMASTTAGDSAVAAMMDQGSEMVAMTFTFTFTFNHLADAFIQSDIQMRRTIEAIRPSREQQYTSAMTSLS